MATIPGTSPASIPLRRTWSICGSVCMASLRLSVAGSAIFRLRTAEGNDGETSLSPATRRPGPPPSPRADGVAWQSARGDLKLRDIALGWAPMGGLLMVDRRQILQGAGSAVALAASGLLARAAPAPAKAPLVAGLPSGVYDT